VGGAANDGGGFAVKPVWIRAGLIALLLLPVASVWVVWLRSGSEPARVYGVVPEFALTEASGRSVTLEDLRGKVWIASFIFTHCAGQCPIMTHHLALAQRELPAREDLKLVSISVDPDRDTPAVLTRYAADHKADRSRWWFLTGDKAVIRRLAIETFKLPVADNPGSEEEPILHSSKFVLMDRAGAIRGYYDGLEVETVRQLVRDARRLLAERS
jgi:cytochrome oxidase Cu insertion factor (SCO1/SenC/PrrC family)